MSGKEKKKVKKLKVVTIGVIEDVFLKALEPFNLSKKSLERLLPKLTRDVLSEGNEDKK